MTNIEQKALELVNEAALNDEPWTLDDVLGGVVFKALCRAIEQHEAFRLEVSDAVRVLDEFITGSEDYKRGSRTDGVHLADGRSVKFARFIIAKPDPLAEALAECGINPLESGADKLRAALAKRGGRIVFDD